MIGESQVQRNGVAWKVTFRRDRFTPAHKREDFVIVAPEDGLQLILDALRSVHPDALIDTTERLGEALIADHMWKVYADYMHDRRECRGGGDG